MSNSFENQTFKKIATKLKSRATEQTPFSAFEKSQNQAFLRLLNQKARAASLFLPSPKIQKDMDISVQELKKRMAEGEDLAIIDVREPYEFDDFNIGARLIPLGDLMNRAHEIEDWKSREIIVHCRSGMRSGMAKNLLLGAGFENVRNLEGGMLAWTEM